MESEKRFIFPIQGSMQVLDVYISENLEYSQRLLVFMQDIHVRISQKSRREFWRCIKAFMSVKGSHTHARTHNLQNCLESRAGKSTPPCFGRL